MITKYKGIEYELPKVTLLVDNGIGHSEYAGRIAYDSFVNSEHESIREHKLEEIGKIESSDLLNQLAWVHHHHSVLEHSSLSFLIEGTSRGVLQEIVRHRMASYTVRSTRYTMSGVINAFVASLQEQTSTHQDMFIDLAQTLNLFVTTDALYNKIQLIDIFNKLKYQYQEIGDEDFIASAVAKSSVTHALSDNTSREKFRLLQDGKKKRNVGDMFKHIVNDNWRVDMVVTFNLRSLKNYFTLRDSGAAYFQIQWLAQAMKEVTPNKYLDLIIKKDK